MTGDKNQPIAMFNVDHANRELRDKFHKSLDQVLDHGAFIEGPECRELEAMLVEMTGARHAVVMGSGTVALTGALLAQGIHAGDDVFVPAFTYGATANAVLRTGGRPIFVDVRPQDGNLDPVALEAAIERAKADPDKNPKAIIAVDLYGRAAPYEALQKLADAHDLPLIADAAQSFGAMYRGSPVGTLAPMTAISFYPTKPLGALGDGGAVLVNDDELAELCRSVRWQGTDPAHALFEREGLNGRLDSLQCAFLIDKLPTFEGSVKRRQHFTALYHDLLEDHVPVLPERPGKDGTADAAALVTVLVERDRDQVMAALRAENIGCAMYYNRALPDHGAFAPFAAGEDFPVARKLADQVLSLPLHAGLTDDDVERVAAAFLRATGKGN